LPPNGRARGRRVVLAASRCRAQVSRAACFGATYAALLLACVGARAADLGTVDDFDVRLDVSVRETLAFRTEPANPNLLSNINADDGDRSFRPGLISARLDVLTELTAERGDLGFDLSAQGWYDPLYHETNANNSPQTFNPYTVPNNQFPADVRTLMGGDAELLNAYVKDKFTLDDTPISVRLGRQTLLWGESLFFADNGIAAGQAPVDFIKAQSAPLAEARELYLPVTQLVVRAELAPGLALEAYDQFEWRRDRLPGVTSYFSTTDILDVGGEQVLEPNGNSLYRTSDSTPHGIGQFGAALRLQGDTADYGLYALRYDSKLPEPVFDTGNSTYHLVFPTGIDIEGVSASTYLGDSNVAGEISFRQHMPLAASAAGLPGGAAGGGGAVYAAAYGGPNIPFYPAPPPPEPAYTGSTGGYATGDTWHAQASVVSQFAPSRWWQAATLEGEIASNDLIEVTGGHPYVLTGRTHFAVSAQAVFTPTWFQVLPGLDVGLPVGLGYTPLGRSSLDTTENAGTGDATVGVSATYRTVWQAAAAFTHFIGGATDQRLADRDFVTISLARSF
jgi:hypothetical protein